MNKFKQSAYTLLLAATCFIASPLIFHQIWKSSATAKKHTQSPPPVVKTTDKSASASSEKHLLGPVAPGNKPESDAPQPTYASAADAPAEEKNVKPDIFVTSDASYFDDALFIGDSRTVGIKEYGSLKNAEFFCEPGFSAGTINDAKVGDKKLDDILDDGKFRKVYIMLGINEVSNDFEFTVGAFRALVEKVMEKQPDALIFLQANLHVTTDAQDKVITNSGIDALNSAISELADDKRIFYLDINELYDDEHGALNEGYTDDGVHPFSMYYTQWCDWLCTKTVPVPEPQTTAPETTAAQPAETTSAVTETQTESAETTTGD